MERRDFLKAGCGYCGALVTISVLGPLLDGCKPSDLIFHAEVANKSISVPIEKFAEKKYLIIRNSNIDFDLLLVKDIDNTFHALAMQCTHRQQPLVVTSTGLICNEHGSRFDLDGNVTQDPATRPLQKFTTQVVGPNVLIHIT
ncbi:MAG: Rieske 2Fe-2S domain-containing protein [Bacteroidota bacterium]